ncbi:nucleoside 2-deoxyribosyltransferase [Phaeobacter sp. CNT1-3]|nr:nucleoside 2-deoxyribosyltransferase [Phaeobacter sp. CNT1-3]
MNTVKIFIVGPHIKDRYVAMKNFVEKHCAAKWPDVDVEVVAPTDNPKTDSFNDWIFGQIDTCDLLIADLSGFNPNVVYEVAFAHTLGTPCVYVQFPDDNQDEQISEKIKHYFKLSLMAEAGEGPSVTEVTKAELNQGAQDYLSAHLDRFLSGRNVLGQSILSDYYGAFPADAEFMRGLAEGYYRNLLKPVLEADRTNAKLKLIIPDTFETTDAEIDYIKNQHIPGEYTPFPGAVNSLGRPLFFKLHGEDSNAFFYDIPTTILTITKSSKYVKISETDYFSAAVRDALTDKLARKFVAHIWALIKKDRSTIKMPLENLEVLWLSQVVENWHRDESLMNSEPLVRPQGF